MTQKCKPTETPPTGLWTSVLKPRVWNCGHWILGFAEPEMTKNGSPSGYKCNRITSKTPVYPCTQVKGDLRPGAYVLCARR